MCCVLHLQPERQGRPYPTQYDIAKTPSAWHIEKKYNDDVGRTSVLTTISHLHVGGGWVLGGGRCGGE